MSDVLALSLLALLNVGVMQFLRYARSRPQAEEMRLLRRENGVPNWLEKGLERFVDGILWVQLLVAACWALVELALVIW